MASEAVSVRHLERIQEEERGGRAPKLAAAVLAALAGGALLTATVMPLTRNADEERSKPDPLAELVQKAKASAAEAPLPEQRLAPAQATFASRLTDDPAATTALVVVKDEQGQLIPLAETEQAQPSVPPGAGDQLPVVPLPAGNLLQATSVTTAPDDELSLLAAQKSRPELTDESAPSGGEGGFQLQVASFRDQAEADKFVDELKTRGHKAYRQAAYVPGRGLWHRVRVGPFKYKYQANQYRSEFEKKERMSTFVVDPEKEERREQARAAHEAQAED